MKTLLIEDDACMAAEVAAAIAARGHWVTKVADGALGLEAALAEQFDVIVTDRRLPGLDGLQIVQALRSAGRDTPILLLSALGSVEDRVTGLRAGGDDYLAKPFATAELLARVESLARRARSASLTLLRVEDLELDLVQRSARRGARVLELTTREFKLLEFLARHAGEVVTRSMLLQEVWDIHYDPQTNVVDVHVSRLRQSVDRGFERPLIHTVRGAGYSLRAG